MVGRSHQVASCHVHRARSSPVTRAWPPGRIGLVQEASSMTEQETTARRAIEFFNAGDYAGMAAITTNDYVYADVGSGRRATGIDEIIKVAEAWTQGLAQAKRTIPNRAAARD